VFFTLLIMSAVQTREQVANDHLDRILEMVEYTQVLTDSQLAQVAIAALNELHDIKSTLDVYNSAERHLYTVYDFS